MKSTPFLRPVKADEFLPPVSRWTTIGGGILLSGVGLALVLAALLKYSITVKAPATLRPSGEVRIVQAKLEGTIASIAVKENQTVRQGDVIAQLDRARLETQKNQLVTTVQQSQLQLTQMQAQIQLLDTQITAQARSIDQEISVAQSELDRNQRELGERQVTTQADVAAAEAALQLAQSEMQRYAQLVDSGAVSQLQLEEKQAAVRTAAAQIVRAEATVNPSDAPVSIAQDRIAQAVATGRATLATLKREQEVLIQQRSEIQAQRLRDQQALQQAEAELQNSVIRATSDGIVLRSNLRNVNQVVRSGDTLVEIAPSNNALTVKARVALQDIGNVKPGQMAQLRISACPYPDYGTLQGTVTAVSPDAIAANPSNLASLPLNEGSPSYYEVTIQPSQSVLGQGNRQCQIQAGMEAEANIISRQETFLQFVLRKARLLTDL
ncbi:MAG: HlyD family efflux transporter periplasmic adaptor subunit [Oscillatoriophycideae cyanobacterium NC_groundwater_1537_Pr4_S-0.65um_50_18]|nr:HlyD family efflux transporter periplasmic adaptor subunit [Oscillatoriophycideae cyanobacterium NC_groundwater_1537_Pr4_S-0.65um_50_18]